MSLLQNLRRALMWCLLIAIAYGAVYAIAADSGGIAGVVRDEEGKTLSGVTVTLTSRLTPPTTNATKSNSAGEYSFPALPPGEYLLTAELSGFTATSQTVVLVSSTSSPIVTNLTLARASVPSAFVAAVPSGAKPQFQASGIHGLIDPGGYSASASADAASGILRGMADVKRTDQSPGTSLATSAAKDWPCNIEPQLRAAVAANPDRAEANRRLGQLYLAHAEPARAIPLLKRALQIDSADYVASRELGIALLESGQFDEARTLLIALVERHNLPELHQLLARAEEGSGIFQQAAQEYHVAYREEQSEESVFGEGYELILAGSQADAVSVFQDGEQKYPKSIQLRIGTGTAQFLLGHASEGVRSFLEATDMDPTDPRPYAFLAAASGISAEERERVSESFRRFVDRAPDSAAANYFYALTLSRESANTDTSRIEALLKRAIQLDPGLAKAHLQLADLYAQRKEYNSSLPEYEAAIRLASELIEAHYRLALALQRMGRVEQSAAEMQIFQQSKAKQAPGSENQEINIAQFISVMDAPGEKSSAEIQCSATQR